MSMNIHDIVAASLQRKSLRFFRDEDRSNIIVPVPRGDTGHFLVHISPDEEANDVTIYAAVGHVPAAKVKEVAVTLAELNCKYKAVCWSLPDRHVVVEVHVDLDFVSDPEPCLLLGFSRLAHALMEGHEQLLAAITRAPRRPRSRVFDEVAEILNQTPE